MENFSDMYYLLRFIVDRIFVYLRDMILYEFSGFSEQTDEVDPSETKTRAHPFTKRAIADFVAFFTICAFFCSFVLLSTKSKKENENNCNSPSRPVTVESEVEPLELVEEAEDFIITHATLERPGVNPWGDGIVPDCDLESTFTRRKLGPRNRNRNKSSVKNHQSKTSIFELRASHSQHSQSTQTSEKILQRASNNRDWLIRRTRSGHVYGKYPM